MKQIFLTTSAFLFLVVMIGSMPIFAQPATPVQQATPPPSAPSPTPMSDLERRVSLLETQQTQTVESLKSSNEYNQFLITVVSGIIALLVVTQSVIQGFTTYRQTRRERENDLHQAQREEKRDILEYRGAEQVYSGAEQVSKIMTVVEQTLESRLAAEKEARVEATKAHAELERVLKQFATVEGFYQKFQIAIKSERQAIEQAATRWAQQVSRHDFRRKTNDLNNFARQFDRFKSDFEALEETPLTQFSARVPYIRGIAAHYANHPDLAKQYLTQVVGFQQAESGEPDTAFKRRVANAYYYLGLTESNFGNDQEAIDFFEEANQLDLENRDFLTRVVTAEAYVMANNFDKAEQFIADIEKKVQDIERIEGRLQSFHVRLRSRAALIRANMVILGRQANWRDEAQKLLGAVHVADPQYYFTTSTLAQVHTGQSDPNESRELFREAYDTIEHSGDLLTITEARSKVLLLMVAGMCCKHGLQDEKKSDEYLDRAVDTHNNLPKVGQQVCTVFSPLSKRNENSERIHSHIERIRKGEVLLE